MCCYFHYKHILFMNILNQKPYILMRYINQLLNKIQKSLTQNTIFNIVHVTIIDNIVVKVSVYFP